MGKPKKKIRKTKYIRPKLTVTKYVNGKCVTVKVDISKQRNICLPVEQLHQQGDLHASTSFIQPQQLSGVEAINPTDETVSTCLLSSITMTTKVKIRDDEGSEFTAGQTVFNGSTLTYPATFPAIDKILKYLAEEFKPRPDDVWLLTYPKAATHWFRDIINILLNGDLKVAYDEKYPILELFADPKIIDDLESPRILNTHIPLEYLPKSAMVDNKVIYGVRNPKASSTSFFQMHFHLNSINYSGSFRAFDTLYNADNGLYTLYGSWFQHVQNHWNYFKNKPNGLVVYFEHMKKSPIDEVMKISNFLSMDWDKKFCEDVVNITSFEARKQIAECTYDGAFKEMWKNGEVKLLRKGLIDDWKNCYTVAHNEWFDATYEEKMKNYTALQSKIEFE